MTTVYRAGPFMVDAARRLISVGNKAHSISEKPFEILELLMEGDGRVVEREAFFTRLWGEESPSDATLTQHVFMLRLREIAGDRPISLPFPGRAIGLRILSNERPAWR